MHSWQAVKNNRPNDAPPVVQGHGWHDDGLPRLSVSYATAMVSTTGGGGSMSMYPNETAQLDPAVRLQVVVGTFHA